MFSGVWFQNLNWPIQVLSGTILSLKELGLTLERESEVWSDSIEKKWKISSNHLEIVTGSHEICVACAFI